MGNIKLILCEGVIVQSLSGKFQHNTSQHAFAVFTARVDAHGLAQFLRGTALMDMAMKTDQRLIFFDRLAYSLAADRHHLEPARQG